MIQVGPKCHNMYPYKGEKEGVLRQTHEGEDTKNEHSKQIYFRQIFEV